MATVAVNKNSNDERFTFWVPLELEEPLEKGADGQLPPFVLIKGIITAEIEDADGEVLLRDGMNFDLFKSHGRLTDGHPAIRERVVGEPVSLHPVDIMVDGNLVKAMEMVGKLYLGTDEEPVERGRKIYRQHKAMLASGASRGLGFSVEGSAIKRAPDNRRRILKSLITSVAIDAQPKNNLSWMEPIAASMAGNVAAALGLDIEDIAAGYLGGMVSERAHVRADLLKGVTDDDIRALRLMRKNPQTLTLAGAQAALGDLSKTRIR